MKNRNITFAATPTVSRSALSLVSLTVLLLFAAPPASAIVGGAADGAQHPYVGAVDIRLAGAPIVASGTLISPNVLVTAGHVTQFFDRAGQTRARVTFDPVVSESARWYWGTVLTDPEYTSPETQDDPNDLGLIILDEAVAGVTPAMLPTENFLTGLRGAGHNLLSFDVVGYGTSLRTGPRSTQGLSSFSGDGTRRSGTAEFVASYGGWLQTSPSNGHVCYGDSGGPVLLGNIAVAIHKANANGNFCEGVTFDMRLDTPGHRAFLQQYVLLP